MAALKTRAATSQAGEGGGRCRKKEDLSVLKFRAAEMPSVSERELSLSCTANETVFISLRKFDNIQ